MLLAALLLDFSLSSRAQSGSATPSAHVEPLVGTVPSRLLDC